MADSAICQRCGVAVGADSAQGLCPACLLEQGLYDSQAATLPLGGEATPGADLAKLVGQFPQLEILELVGRGGMGVVYKARHRGLDRMVALKILPPGVDRDPGFQERFVREARALARLNHPNIVAVYDFGQVEGRYYFLMEFVDGANLRRMLQAGHLTPPQAMAIVPQLCDALQFAHEEGIVHRDIKPENILLDRKGRVKIADFGLAKLVNSACPPDPYTLTSARQVLGTPHYMAPEQFERPGSVDRRADIFSLGVVFYEMLTGELPLGRFPPPSHKVHIDVRLDEVVLRTLEKEPEHRYQRAGEVKTELASMTSEAPAGPTRSSAGDIGSSGPREPGPARRPALSPCSIGGLIAALLFPLAWMATGLFFASDVTPHDQDSIVSLLAVFGVTCTVTSCALGLAGIRQVRRSGGRYYGLKLALFDALAYPLLLLDMMLIWVTMVALFSDAPVPGRVVIPIFALALALDFWIVRRIWRWLSRTPGIRPAQPEPFRRPPRPVQPSNRAYVLPPKRGLAGVFIVVGFVLFLLALLVLLMFYLARESRSVAMQRAAATEMRARTEAAQVGQAVIRPDGPGDAGGKGRIHRFKIHSPIDTKTTLWAELWKSGRMEMAPGFDVVQWIIPAPDQGFDGSATFSTEPRPDGKMKVGWQINGNVGSIMSEKPVPDPFAGMRFRDSSWGRRPGPWPVTPGQPVELLVLRGATKPLTGSPDDENMTGQADVELRLFARFDPLTPQEQGRGPSIDSSQQQPVQRTGRAIETDPLQTPPAVVQPAVPLLPGSTDPSAAPPAPAVAPPAVPRPPDAPSAPLPPAGVPPGESEGPSELAPPGRTEAPSAVPPARELPAGDPSITPAGPKVPGNPDISIGGRS